MKKITAKQASDALEKGIYQRDRSWAAESRAMRNGSSITGDRERRTANNWEARAEKQFDIVRRFLAQHGEGVWFPPEEEAQPFPPKQES